MRATNRTTPSSPTPPAKIQIGVWGGTGSGKTTFLAALRIAALRNPSGRWMINGNDMEQPGSGIQLASATNTLLQGRFPAATTNEIDLSYDVSGILNRDLVSGLAERVQLMRSRDINFALRLKDVPGGTFVRTADVNDAIWQYFSECDGLVYLFDPEMEDTNNQTPGLLNLTNYQYVQLTADFIRQNLLMRSRQRLIRNHLPHFVAICISKYDDPPVFRKLQVNGLITQDPKDPRGTPQVISPQQAFNTIVQDTLTLSTFRSYFLEERIRFFTSSAVGFYADTTTGRIDLNDCYNIVSGESDRRLRGREVHPVNVFDPFIWLENVISKSRGIR